MLLFHLPKTDKAKATDVKVKEGERQRASADLSWGWLRLTGTEPPD